MMSKLFKKEGEVEWFDFTYQTTGLHDQELTLTRI
jgi:hypothetical protein